MVRATMARVDILGSTSAFSILLNVPRESSDSSVTRSWLYPLDLLIFAICCPNLVRKSFLSKLSSFFTEHEITRINGLARCLQAGIIWAWETCILFLFDKISIWKSSPKFFFCLLFSYFPNRFLPRVDPVQMSLVAMTTRVEFFMPSQEAHVLLPWPTKHVSRAIILAACVRDVLVSARMEVGSFLAKTNRWLFALLVEPVVLQFLSFPEWVPTYSWWSSLRQLLHFWGGARVLLEAHMLKWFAHTVW